MKYLITGITGFAGPHLAKLLLKEGHEVVGLSRRTNGMETDILDVVSEEEFDKIRFVIADLTDREVVLKIFEEDKFDGVFHLAAMSLPPQSFIDPVGTYRDNVMGSLHLITAIEKTQSSSCRLMFCSTSEVYGNSGADGRLIKESDTIAPSNPYGASKAAVDIFLQERMNNGKINGFITRAFSHTGARRGKNFSISSDAYQIAQFVLENQRREEQGRYSLKFANEKEYELKIGNLTTTRVVIDVADCVNAYYLLMINENSNRQVFNVCGDIPRKMEFFTDKLIEASRAKVKKVIHQPFWREHEIFYQHGDTTKLRELTGWEPKIPIEETLQSLLDYWVAKLSRNED